MILRKMRHDLLLDWFDFSISQIQTLESYIIMQTESISTNQENVETKVTDQSKSLNLRLDCNLGMQLALISGLSGILYYLFSYTCPSSI